MQKIILLVLAVVAASCAQERKSGTTADPTRVLFDSDTNNELDDQHALAYLLFNGGAFELAGVTVNATRSGGAIDLQYAEAERVMRLCDVKDPLPLYKGANSSYDTIKGQVASGTFDGQDAVNFIIREAMQPTEQKLVVIAVGKLTNIALALDKDPKIADRIRLVWLGSNYPEPGEYNLNNDTASLNRVLASNLPFEIVTVRYGKPNGSDVVRLTKDEVLTKMPGKGPHIMNPITGRHGGAFTSFGDYSANLFEHIHYSGDPPSRALFDMVAVAIVKNPAWGKHEEISAPRYVANSWVDQPNNKRTVVVWGDFDKDAIIADYYRTLDNVQPVKIVN